MYYYYFHLTPQPIRREHSWMPGRHRLLRRGAVRPRHPSRVVWPFAYLISGYERVFYIYGPLFGLILLTGLGGAGLRHPPAPPADPAFRRRLRLGRWRDGAGA